MFKKVLLTKVLQKQKVYNKQDKAKILRTYKNYKKRENK